MKVKALVNLYFAGRLLRKGEVYELPETLSDVIKKNAESGFLEIIAENQKKPSPEKTEKPSQSPTSGAPKEKEEKRESEESGETYICPYCGKVYKSKYFFEKHLDKCPKKPKE